MPGQIRAVSFVWLSLLGTLVMTCGEVTEPPEEGRAGPAAESDGAGTPPMFVAEPAENEGAVIEPGAYVEAPPVTCPNGQALCGGRCVRIDSDPRNCGSCGRVCQPGAECRQRQCVRATCPTGQAMCGGVCRDVRSDPRNCGGCGRQCTPDQRCQNGVCTVTL